MPRLFNPYPPSRQFALAQAVVEKADAFPALDGHVIGTSHYRASRVLRLAQVRPALKNWPHRGRLPVYEGASISVLGLRPELLRFWVDAQQGRTLVLGGQLDQGQRLSCDDYQLAIRRNASTTDARCLTATVVPPAVLLDTLQGLWIPASTDARVAARALLYLGAVLSSLVADFLFRERLHLPSMRKLAKLPVPARTAGGGPQEGLIHRAAQLVCTSDPFDRLARDAEVPMGDSGDAAMRGRLQAEIDGAVAHLYGLSEEEFQMVLSQYPLVPDPAKLAAHNAYRDIERGVRR